MKFISTPILIDNNKYRRRQHFATVTVFGYGSIADFTA